MNASITFTPTANGCTFQLLDATRAMLPFRVWAQHDAGIEVGVAVLTNFEQSGNASVDDAGMRLTVEAAWLASLDEQRSAVIGLPPPVPCVLQIDARGSLPRLRLETCWIDEDKLRVRDATTTGVIFNAKGRPYRLVSPLFDILSAVAAFNAREDASPDEQLADWAEIQELIGADPEQIRTRGFVDRLRVARATRFTLEFVPDEGGGFQIAPVPLAFRRRLLQDEEPEENIPKDEEAIRLLGSVEQGTFQRSFRAKRDVQTSYVGGDGTYVLFTPEVRRCLEVVRRMQDRPPHERLAFASNPFPYLRDGSTSEDEIPFAESRSFSDRVSGIGPIEKPTLPWQILQSQGWLPPETVRVRIADREITVTPAAIDPAIIDIEHSMAQQRSSVTIEGQEVEASAYSRDAFLEARKTLDERATTEAPVQVSCLPGSHERIGLLTKRNLDETEYIARRSERAALPAGVPEIATTLHKWQLEALVWLQARWSNGHRGALLADDMGLGKTLSALAFMMWLRRGMLDGRIKRKPMLIVAPVSLLEVWQAEHDRHIGDYEVRFQDIVRAYGTSLPRHHSGAHAGERGSMMLDLDRLTQDRFGEPTCVLTTYETLREYQQSFASIAFGLIVLDEAQRIKNPASLSWSAVSTLNGDFWLALSGTPVENRLADLWAITDAIQPDFLGTLRQFSATYEKTYDEQALRRLKDLLENSEDGSPFMLRRLKEHILDGLPAKTPYARASPMPTVQETAYAAIISNAQGINSRKHMLEIIQEMREVSLHPHLMEMSDGQAYIASSARFHLLFEILDAIREKGEKALIFLDRNIVEAYLARLIQQRYSLDTLPAIINGEVAGDKRQRSVDQFQDPKRRGFDVMILSPKAGGVGLTLTAANHVIHLSRWWNPAVEDQATDRVYRIGQRKPVHVYYLQAVLADRPNQSFDERLHALLEKKRALSRELLWPYQSDESDAEALIGH